MGNGNSDKIIFMNFKNISIMLIFLLLFVPALFSQNPTTMRVRVIHTSDTYNRFLPSESGLGGIPQRTYLIKKLADEIQNRILIVDSGDAFGPHPLIASDEGRSIIEFMSEAGYLAMGLGNHEFDYGSDKLLKWISEAPFAILSANVMRKADNSHFTKPYLIKPLSGIKFGIFGLTTPETKFRTDPKNVKDVKFVDPIKAAKDAITALKAENVDFIIALTHLGYKDDMNLVDQVDGIDLLIGSEVRMREEKSLGQMMPINDQEGTVMVYCPSDGAYVGQVDLEFTIDESSGKIKPSKPSRWNFAKYRLDRNLTPDDVVKATIPKLWKKFSEKVESYYQSGREILAELSGSEKISAENLISVILQDKTDAEVVLLNRGSLKPQLFSGQIQQIQISEALRYESRFVTLELTGKQIKEALRYSSSQNVTNRQLVTFGISNDQTKINSRLINDAEYYRVVTNDFLASGGDGYTMIASGRNESEGEEIREVVSSYLQRLSERNIKLSMTQFKGYPKKVLFKWKWEIEAMLQGTSVSQVAKKYKQVSELRSKSVGIFAIFGLRNKISSKFNLIDHDIEFNFNSDYSRVKYPKLAPIEIDDNNEANITYRYLFSSELSPLLRVELKDIELSPSKDHSILGLLSGGVEYKKFKSIVLSGGFMARRRLKAGEITPLGLDLRASYRSTFWQKMDVKSDLEFFPNFQADLSELLSFENYVARWKTIANFRLHRNLFLSGNSILYRDTRIARWAYNTYIALQFHNSWGMKA